VKLVALALLLIPLHGPTGQRIDVNPDEVTSVREPQRGSTLSEKVHCVIGMTNGRFIALGDDCSTVRRAMGQTDVGKPPCVMVCGGIR
jgi:hypothetical protein